MNFFPSYPEGESGALGICIYYVLSYISFSVIPLSHRYAGYSLVANPQSIKWLGHFLTADNISAGTPNGGKDISGATERLTEDGHIRRYGGVIGN